MMIRYLIVVVMCIVSYGDHLTGEFVFDDRVAIVKNHLVTKPTGDLFQFLQYDFWGMNISSNASHKSFRPLTTLTFRTEFRLNNGLNAFRMKLLNLILHIVSSCLLIPFGKLIFTNGRETAFVAALLFATHSVHTEAVSGIVGRADLLATIIFFLAVMIYFVNFIDFRRTRSNYTKFFSYLTVIVATVVAVLFKETGFVILPMCAYLEFLYNSNLIQKLIHFARSEPLEVGKGVWLRTSGLLISALGILMARLRLGRPSFKEEDNPVAACNDFLTRVINQTFLYAINWWLLICPDWLSFDWAIGSIELIKNPMTDYRILAVLLLLSFFICLFWVSSRKLLVATGLLIIPFLPASGIIPLGFVIAERILYMPSIGFCFLIATGYYRIVSFCDRRMTKGLIKSLLVVTLFVFIVKTRHRSADWLTEEQLFNSALRVCPKNAKVHFNIAKVAADKNEIDKAFHYYHTAIELYPRYETALMNLGNLYRAKGELKRAEHYFLESLSILQAFPAAWMNLGIVQASLGRHTEALDSYNRALSFRPKYATCYYNMGNAYVAINQSDLAYRSWQQAVAIDPTLTKAWANLLALLNNQNKLQEVLDVSVQAALSLPNEPDLMFTKASVLGKLNRFAESEKVFLQIISSRPDSASYHANLGVLYHRWKKYDLSRKHYATALAIDPHMKIARNYLNQLNRKDF